MNLLNLSVSWNWNCSGDMRAVLKLANQLVSQAGLRQGWPTGKAARGYHLAQGNPARENQTDHHFACCGKS